MCDIAHQVSPTGSRTGLVIMVFAVAAAPLWAVAVATAADPQSYSVSIASTGSKALDSTARATSQLEGLRTSAPVSPFGLIARARQDLERLQTVLQSFGYYQGTVGITVNGMGLDDAMLADTIAALADDSKAKVAIVLNPGPLYRLRRIDVDPVLPATLRNALNIEPGAPAVAADVLAAGARLLTALQEGGYAFARVDPPIAYEDPDARVLDVSFHVTAGAAVTVGAIRIEGLKQVHERAVRQRLALRSGEPYRASSIEAARQRLLTLGVIAAVTVKVGDEADAQGRVPVTFEVRERLRHAVGFTTAFSSDLGGSLGVTWSDRNLFGNAEQLNLSATAINLGGRATTSLGYDTGAQFIKPDFGRNDQSLQLSVAAIKQSLQAYDQSAGTAGILLNRRFSSLWSGSIGFTTAHESITQESATRDYTLLAVPVAILYNTTGVSTPLADARHGWRAQLSVAPTESLGHPSATFIINQVNVAAFFDLSALGGQSAGRSVLALRALAANAQGAGQFDLPPDQRFYGGGSSTIRGYRYQSVGPQFADGNPVGGTALDAGSVELRQRIGMNWGAAVFVDAGEVSVRALPFSGVLSIGVGVGARYYTPIGAIRLDVALPTRRRSTDDSFEVYIGLGQPF